MTAIQSWPRPPCLAGAKSLSLIRSGVNARIHHPPADFAWRILRKIPSPLPSDRLSFALTLADVFSLRLLDGVGAAGDDAAAHGGNVAPQLGDARLLLLAEDSLGPRSPLLCETTSGGDTGQKVLCRAIEVGEPDGGASGSRIVVSLCGDGSECGRFAFCTSRNRHARDALVECDPHGRLSIRFCSPGLCNGASAVTADSRGFFASLVVPLAGVSRRAPSV